MHELGIVFHIIKQVEEIALSHQVREVKKVTLEIGEVSGVVPSYLEDCWKWACRNRSEHMKACELEIVTLSASSYCEDCKEFYETVKHGRTCPYCGGGNTYLVTGNETNIRDIQVI